MATITIKFTFVRGEETETESNDFDVNSGLVYDCDTFAEEWVDERNSEESDDDDENVDEWGFVEYVVEEFDDDFADPGEFGDLDEYGEYVEKCEEHGEGYKLRYADIGDFNFNDQYQGCWRSTEEWAQDYYEGCYEIPDHLASYIDWESVARDLMMDCSEYDGDEGVHIFRD